MKNLKSRYKKEIFIKTFVLGANHGQYLQAYGLSLAVSSILKKYKIFHPFYSNHWLKELCNHCVNLSLIKYLSFLYYWLKRFNFKSKNLFCEIELYGSDMIWHNNSKLFKFDKFYFTQNKFCKKAISFAPSVGSRNISKEPKFLEELKTFNFLSVRDRNTKEFVKKYVSEDPFLVCDPALFLNYGKLDIDHLNRKFKVERKNVISIYGNNKIFAPVIENNKTSYEDTKFRSVGYFRRYQFLNYLFQQFDDPLKVINYFNESRLILTTTFHGVIISLLTKRPFFAIADNNLMARLSVYNKFYSIKRVVHINELDNLSNSINLSEIENSEDIDYVGLSMFVSNSYSWLEKSLKHK